jgi:Kef-type K+ transport system membrane component KefB/mannitol/fructose-specific phosphotransferase system IIA component (Ntr-type)
MQLNSGQVTIFLLSISLMLLAAKLLGELFTKIKQPPIVGEILAGLLLGPTVLGMIAPDFFNTVFPMKGEVGIALEGIVSLAVVMLLLVSGIEVDLSIVLKQGKAAISTGLMGIILPFTVGFGFSFFFPGLMGIQDRNMVFVFALFMGTALSISALPVIAKTLMDLKIFNSEIGYIIISAAMFNDLIGWLIFSVILGMISGEAHGMSFGTTLTLTLVFMFFTLIFVRKLFNRILPWVQKKISFPGGVLNLILITGFLGAAFTEYIGIHAIFGAFMVGIAVGDSAHLNERTRELIHQFVTNIFAPLFFVSIGLRVNFIANFDLQLVLIILALSFAGKVIGCGLGAYWAGMNKNDSLIIGFGMNSRGTMEVILGLLALQFGLIQESVFVALVIMALFTSISSAPVMNYFLKKRKKLSFNDLLVPDLVQFTNADSKEEIIHLLVNQVGKTQKLKSDDVYNAVMERESLLSTGIANYLAIPHAKVKINQPVIAVAINEKGIDFDADDKLLSRIIILLLSPSNDNEIQLKLLSEIAAKFSNREKSEKLIEIKDKNKFIEELKLV